MVSETEKTSEAKTSEVFLLSALIIFGGKNHSILSAMKYRLQPALILLLLLLPALTSCQRTRILAPGETLQLTTSSENYVEVVITLHRGENDQYTLSATFNPLEAGLHLYSKDIPRTGVEGLGRPTLFELPADSAIVALGQTMESQSPQNPTNDPVELKTYPEGPVTLSIPILLPEGNEWLDQQVIVTYMTCSDRGCRAPVENKTLAIRIPARGLIQ